MITFGRQEGCIAFESRPHFGSGSCITGNPQTNIIPGRAFVYIWSVRGLHRWRAVLISAPALVFQETRKPISYLVGLLNTFGRLEGCNALGSRPYFGSGSCSTGNPQNPLHTAGRAHNYIWLAIVVKRWIAVLTSAPNLVLPNNLVGLMITFDLRL